MRDVRSCRSVVDCLHGTVRTTCSSDSCCIETRSAACYSMVQTSMVPSCHSRTKTYIQRPNPARSWMMRFCNETRNSFPSHQAMDKEYRTIRPPLAFPYGFAIFVCHPLWTSTCFVLASGSPTSVVSLARSLGKASIPDDHIGHSCRPFTHAD
jgi:hypothetical protein